MACELFSFYALRGDQSVADWDMANCINEAAAAEHAAAMAARHPDVTVVEVWGLGRLCFSTPSQNR